MKRGRFEPVCGDTPLREIGGKLSFESLSLALAARGSELFTERLAPTISGSGDTMKETLNKVFDAVSRDPLPVFIMGVGAGLVLLSLYSGRKAGKDPEELETALAPLLRGATGGGRSRAKAKIAISLFGVHLVGPLGACPGRRHVRRYSGDQFRKSGRIKNGPIYKGYRDRRRVH